MRYDNLCRYMRLRDTTYKSEPRTNLLSDTAFTPTDTRTLKPHLEKVKTQLGRLPGTVIADAGYGSEEDYAYLEGEEVRTIVKYNTYHKEKTKAWKKDISKLDNWQYDEAKDTWICPAGQRLTFIRESKEKNESGYEVRKWHYRSISCIQCPLKALCTKASGEREIQVSMNYLRYKRQAREQLTSKEGYALSVQRMHEPESVFGQVKNNRGIPSLPASRFIQSKPWGRVAFPCPQSSESWATKPTKTNNRPGMNPPGRLFFQSKAFLNPLAGKLTTFWDSPLFINGISLFAGVRPDPRNDILAPAACR